MPKKISPYQLAREKEAAKQIEERKRKKKEAETVELDPQKADSYVSQSQN